MRPETGGRATARQSVCLEAAIAYARRGYPVFALHSIRDGHCTCGAADCGSPGKHPLGGLVPHGLLGASTDEEAIRSWWAERPEANVGICAGEGSGTVVIDVDVKAGGEETLRALEASHGPLPDTLTARTGSGGRHVFFQHPGWKVRNSVGQAGLGRGLDVRGDGGYVVAPPSRHIRGTYEWVNADAEIAPLPGWLVDLLRADERTSSSCEPVNPRPPGMGATPYARAALERERQAVAQAPAGARNSTLNAAGFAMGQLVGGGEIGRLIVEDALASAGMQSGLPEREVRTTLRSGLEAGLHEPRTAPAPPAPPSPERIGPGSGRVSSEQGGAADGNPSRFFQGSSFRPALLADELMRMDRYLATPVAEDGVGAFLYVYRDGVYRRGEECASRVAERLLGALAKNAFIDDAVKLIRRRTTVGHDTLNPRGLDLINVENGMLDWRTGRLLPHEPGHLSTIRIPVRYVPGARSEIIERVLREWLPPDAHGLMAEVLGHLLTPTRKHQSAIMLSGDGENGKSTLINLMRALLGRSNVSSETLHDLEENRFRVASLFGKLANLCADIDDRSLRFTSVFKKIVGDDSVAAERKHQHPFDFDPFARLIFSANSPPTPGSDRTHAFFRRWVIVPFGNSFADPKRRDRDLLRKITTPEALSALLNIALFGLRRLEERGSFELPDSVRAAGETYRRDGDAVHTFLSDECRQGGQDDWIATSDLNRRFQVWCRENGYRFVPPKAALDQRVAAVFSVEKGRRRVGGRGNPVTAWKGVLCSYSPPAQQGLEDGGPWATGTGEV